MSWREVNRAHWDERVPIHVAGAFYDVEGFRAGREVLRPFELEEMGEVAGRELVHLQCHFGQDTLAWARHGARVTGSTSSTRAWGRCAGCRTSSAGRRLWRRCCVSTAFCT